MFDKFTALVSQARFSVFLLGNLHTRDFEIYPVEAPVPAATDAAYDGRGLEFLGCAGIVEGRPRTELNGPLDDAAITALSQQYAGYVAGLLSARTQEPEVKDDSEAWLWRLWSLPDTRPEA